MKNSRGFAWLPVLFVVGLVVVAGGAYVSMRQDVSQSIGTQSEGLPSNTPASRTTSSTQSARTTSASGGTAASQPAGTIAVSGTYEWDANYAGGFLLLRFDEANRAKILSLAPGSASNDNCFTFSNNTFARQSLTGNSGAAIFIVKNYRPGKPDTGTCNSVEFVSAAQ